MRHHAVDQWLGRRHVGLVALDRESPDALRFLQLLDDSFGLLGRRDVADRNVRPVVGKRLRHGGAEPARAAGNEGDLAFNMFDMRILFPCTMRAPPSRERQRLIFVMVITITLGMKSGQGLSSGLVMTIMKKAELG